MSDILAHLYEEYVATENVPGSSSHWQEYQKHFVFELNEDGKPSVISGLGFGDLEAKATLRRYAKESLSFVRTILSPLALQNWFLMRAGKHVAHAMGLAYAQDAWRQAMTLAFLKVQGVIPEPPGVVMIIGDGYGLLSGLIHRIYPETPIVTIDLGSTLCFQVSGLQRAFPNARHVLVGEARAAGDWDFLYVPAGRIDEIPDTPFSLTVNIASMQEMTPETVADYFTFMRNRSVQHFYCCNRERKVLVGGEVNIFQEYPWSSKDLHLIDEECPWHGYFLDRQTLSNGPRILNFRIPFVNYFDGKVRHRLTVLESSEV